MKISAPKINVKANQYWLLQASDYVGLQIYLECFRKAGLKVKYERLNTYGYIGCFYIGRKPTKFIKNIEYDINSGQPG